MKYASEMCLGAMIHSYTLGFINIGSAIQKLIGGYTETNTAWG
jgi:hypothetical protein